jgi:hypothetical protein
VIPVTQFCELYLVGPPPPHPPLALNFSIFPPFFALDFRPCWGLVGRVHGFEKKGSDADKDKFTMCHDINAFVVTRVCVKMPVMEDNVTVNDFEVFSMDERLNPKDFMKVGSIKDE